MRIVLSAVAAVLLLVAAAEGRAHGLGHADRCTQSCRQPEISLAEQLKAYRSGRRVHDVMNVIVKPLSDAGIADLAAGYASFAMEVKEKK